MLAPRHLRIPASQPSIIAAVIGDRVAEMRYNALDMPQIAGHSCLRKEVR